MSYNLISICYCFLNKNKQYGAFQILETLCFVETIAY